jgi:NADH:ubiquinone oxidoreductase subunit D
MESMIHHFKYSLMVTVPKGETLRQFEAYQRGEFGVYLVTDDKPLE